MVKMSGAKRKLKALTLSDKVRLLSEVDKGVKKKKVIAAEFGIPANTLSTILKNRKELLKKAEDGVSSDRKKFKVCTYEDIDAAVLEWIKMIRDKDIAISGRLIREKALFFAEYWGYTDFVASVGWLDKFKKRHNINIQEQFSRTSVDGDQESSKNVDEDSFRVEPNTISIYCRLCLKPASSETVTPLCVVDCNYSGKSEASKKKKLEEIEEIQTMIKLCLPFFDSLTSNPVICCLCLTNLKTSYVFISQCVKTQKFISEYVNTFAVTEMSLTDVVDSNFIASSKKVNVANTLDSSQQVNTRVANSRVIDMFQSDLIPPNKQAENESNVVMNPAVATIPARGVQTDGHNEAVCYNNSSSSKRSKPQNPYEETLESTMASSEEVFVKIEPYGDSFQATVDSIKIETDIDILESTMTSGQKVVVKIEPDGDNFESTVDSTKIETNKQTLESPVTSSEEIILKTELDGDSLKSTIDSIKMEMDFIDYIDFGKTELIDVGRIDNIGKNSND